MSQTNKEVKKVKEPAKWEELEYAYKATAQTYMMVSGYFQNLYKKYKDLIDKEPNIKLILDGGANTLMGIKKMIDTLAISHLEPATEEDKKNGVEVFEGPDGKLVKFKTGTIDTDNDKETEIVIRNLLAYTSLSGNLFIVSKNTVSSLVTDLEKLIESIEDEEEKEKVAKLLEADKEEIKALNEEGDNNGENEQK